MKTTTMLLLVIAILCLSADQALSVVIELHQNDPDGDDPAVGINEMLEDAINPGEGPGVQDFITLDNVDGGYLVAVDLEFPGLEANIPRLVEDI